MDSKTYARSIAVSNFNALRLSNIRNDNISLEFVRNLSILFLNEQDSTDKNFSSAFDFYNKLIPKLVHNGVQDDSQKQSNTEIVTGLQYVIDNYFNSNYKPNSQSNIDKIKFTLIYNFLNNATNNVNECAKLAFNDKTKDKTIIKNYDDAVDEAYYAYDEYVSNPNPYNDLHTSDTYVEDADAKAEIDAKNILEGMQKSKCDIPSLLSNISINNLLMSSKMNALLPTDTDSIEIIKLLKDNKMLESLGTVNNFSLTNFENYITSLTDVGNIISKQLLALKNKYQVQATNTQLSTGSILDYGTSNNTFIDYKIKLYNALVENITSYNGNDKDELFSKISDPTLNITQMLTIVNIDKPCFGTAYFSGTNINFKDLTIEKDDKEKTNIYDKRDFILSLSTLSQNLKKLALSTNSNCSLPNGFMGNCRLNYGNGNVKFGTFALINPVLDLNKTPQPTIDLSQKFGMIFMAYNPCSESLSLPQFYLPQF